MYEKLYLIFTFYFIFHMSFSFPGACIMFWMRLYTYVVWLNQKKITCLVFQWRPTLLIWRMEEFQGKNLSHCLNEPSVSSITFLHPTSITLNIYWNDFLYVGGSTCKICYGYTVVGKQFHASIFIIKDLQTKNHKRGIQKRQCMKFQMGR